VGAVFAPVPRLAAAVAKAGEGNVRAAARLFLLAGPKAILNFWGGLLARGPVLLALGYAFAYVGVNVAEQIGVYALGVSLFIIGLGQLAHWLRVPSRFAYSFVGLALILYWSLPTRSEGRLAELGSNPGDFFISGIFLVGGAIVLFLYNADSLLNLFAGVLGRFSSLLPVARVSIAYPVMNKGRTATTLAMFSLIIFTLVSTTTITNTFSNFLDPISGSGDYDVVCRPTRSTRSARSYLESRCRAWLPRRGWLCPKQRPRDLCPGDGAEPRDGRASQLCINGMDEAFFATHRLELGGWATGYESAGGRVGGRTERSGADRHRQLLH
jgi:hypothetical protein